MVEVAEPWKILTAYVLLEEKKNKRLVFSFPTPRSRTGLCSVLNIWFSA